MRNAKWEVRNEVVSCQGSGVRIQFLWCEAIPPCVRREGDRHNSTLFSQDVTSVTINCCYKQSLTDGGGSLRLIIKNSLLRTLHHSAELN